MDYSFEVDKELIYKIPLSVSRSDYTLFWHFDNQQDSD